MKRHSTLEVTDTVNGHLNWRVEYRRGENENFRQTGFRMNFAAEILFWNCRRESSFPQLSPNDKIRNVH